MAHPKKGSPEAKAWAAKMQAARKKSGYRRRKKNPGEAWHEREAGHAHDVVRKTDDPDERVFYAGVESAHRISASAAKKLKMNPDETAYVKQEGWKPLGKKNVLAFSRTVGSLYQILQKEARAWRVLYRTFLTAGADPARSLGTYSTLDRALIAANRQANDWARKNPKKEHVIRPKHRKNPLAVFGVGNPPKRVSIGVAGVLYSRCLEIRAEKLKYKPGLYKHPFTRKAGVQILALDSGDLLVHSTRKVNLWKPV